MAMTTLDPVEYWRLRAVVADLRIAEQAAQALIAQARSKQDAVIADLVQVYSFDPRRPDLCLDDL